MMDYLRNHMKGIMLIIVIAFLASTFLMYERSGTRRSPGRNPDGTMTDYEVAQINGRSLMRSELERRLRNYLENYASRNAVSLDMPAIYQAVLDQAVLESQLAKEVQEKGIRVSDAEADAAMKEYADTYYPTRETFYQYLAQSGIKIEDYKKNLAQQIATQQLIRSEIGEIEISQDRAVEFYDSMKNLIYTKPEGFMIQLANFKKSEAAENLRSRILSGDKWTEIVSNDELSSADLVRITREPVFLSATALNTGYLSPLASLDVGEISKVFEISSSDFAVGVKTEKVPETITPYDEVSKDIMQLLRQQEERRKLSDYEAALMSRAQLVINDTSLFAKTTAPETETSEEIINEEISSSDVVQEVETPKSEDVVEVETPKSEDVIAEAETPKSEDVVEVEAPKSEDVTEVETPKSEDVVEVEAPKSEDVVAEVETPKSEDVTEVETPKTENVIEVETPKSEDAAAEVETNKEEIKSEINQ